MKKTYTFQIAAIVMLTILFSVALANANILVVAPHPDDDALMASGIIARAVGRGEPVRVVYITNGDYLGVSAGYTREGEAVSGQSYLGMAENNLIFLGYPDGYLQTVYNSYPNSTDQFVTPNNGVSATYGNRGLGRADYHSYRFGAPAHYNRANIITDLSDIIAGFRPDHIFVPSQFDYTTDHTTTYYLVQSAATSVCNSNPGYNPVIHKTIIWWAAQYWWPNLPIVWPNSPDPTVSLASIPNLATTGLVWNNRESFNVPLAMQLPNYSDNPKALALNSHLNGQKGVYGYIGFFLHKDEVFWPEVVVGTDHPPVVNAGSDQTVIEGTIVTLNGSQSMDPDGNQLTYQWVQESGIPVQLSNALSASPSFMAPTGLTQDQTLSFTLVVSDGHFTTLPDSVSVRVIVSPSADTNIAPLAAVTASAESTPYGQTAVKAVDGVVDGYLGDGGLQVDGYPGDGTREWAAAGQKAGTWIHLAWPVPYSVDRIVLHDRINLADNITSATIAFSDGSSITVGPLNNNGTSTVYAFPAKIITWFTMTVTGVSSTTYETGLAEIEVFGSPATQGQYTLSTNVAPQGGGSISVSPSGSSYYAGTQVALTATPNIGYAFSGWSGGATGSSNPTTITINSNTSVTANFTAIPGTLTVTPSTGLTTSGAPGGPFAPASAVYTLQNAGNTTINWSASATQSWITLSSNSGSLAPGASTTVTVSINSGANSLAIGNYTDTLTFANLTNGGGSATRVVSLTVAPVAAANIAPLATVTASSDSPQYSQTAAKAVDGCIDGYPGIYTCEWSTNNQGVGAWLNLSLSTPYNVNQVVLYDRPNTSDNITSATITFSDGSSITVGPLNNNGTATTYTFPARVITSLRMTVTGVSGSTQNVGLSEIQVFGVASGGTQYTLATSATPSAGGSVTVNPSQATYSSGQQVTLTATPNTGYTFSGWSGGATGTTNPLTLTITGNTTVTANFTAIPGTLTVTPATGLTASGATGGPFNPSSATYTLQNGGNTTINWSASATQSWVTLSASTGSLAPGASTTVTASINSSANSLAAGSYSNTVTFTNTTNGNGNTTRGISLTIAPQYTLTTNASPSGSGSVTVNPSQASYSSGQQVILTATPNTGYTFSGWSGGATGTTNPLTLTITGNTTVTANFAAIPGTLTVTPSTGLTSSGAPGGPFAPSSATYTLQNGGNTAVVWNATATQGWTTLSAGSGSLAPGASTTVTVSINSGANSLAVGSYSDTVSFTNITNGNGSTTRGVTLTVSSQTTNIAPLATVTASSENSQYGQTAAKAVDGVVDGYPNDSTREWSSNREHAGAWLNLSWSSPYTVNRIVLYDRINLDDNITSATITFSDGSSITVGPLNNNGAATEYTFTARAIMSLRMTVTSVSSTTYEIGLAEIQVFGVASGGTQYTLATSATPSAGGSVTVNPSQATYSSGQQVTLTATPNTGYTFSGWSGGATGTTNPLTLTITGNTTVTANFAAIPGTLTVTPSAGLTSSGATGGPFNPSSATYTLQNGGNTTINWSASATQSWVTLSASSGSLAPGASTTVTASINSSANSLAAGSYSNTVTFTNTTNGNGNTTRGISLTIAPQYTLTTNASPSGSGSVTVNPSQASYSSGQQVTLTATPNTGYTFTGWSGGATGTTNPLTLTITGNTTVTANFAAIPGTLTVTPSTGLTSSGAPGGPFAPSSATYTLQNGGNTTINWNATATQGWTTLSAGSGSLAPGASTTVTVSINSGANSLAVGSYSDTVSFTNITNGNGSTTRGVTLTVSSQTTNIALLATVTASSDSPQYSQTAAKAIDGCIDGYPGTYTCEWATNSQGVGAWLNLSWAAPHSINSIMLYDRPNTDDNITSATITFSDGSSITVGPLNNNGTATTYTFPARVITSLRMTVTGVGARTLNVGLAEIQVFGN